MVLQPAIEFVLDAEIREVNLIVEIGEVMFVRPVPDLLGRAVWVTVVATPRRLLGPKHVAARPSPRER